MELEQYIIDSQKGISKPLVINITNNTNVDIDNVKVLDVSQLMENPNTFGGQILPVWKEETTGTAFPTYPISEMFFINENIGWGVAQWNQIIKTTDGGTTWITQSLSSAPLGIQLFCVFFIDENTGWVGGSSGDISKTTDGGTTWITYTIPSAGIYSIYFINPMLGFLCVGSPSGEIYKTNDGGITWNNVYISGYSDLLKIIFFGSNIGYCSGGNNAADGVILKTTDGGTTWNQLPINRNFEFFAMYVLDENNVYASCTDFSSGKLSYLIKTNDGGTTWKDVSTIINSNIRNITLPTDSTIYLSGNTDNEFMNRGIVYKSIYNGIEFTIDYQTNSSYSTLYSLVKLNTINIVSAGKIVIKYLGDNLTYSSTQGITFQTLNYDILVHDYLIGETYIYSNNAENINSNLKVEFFDVRGTGNYNLVYNGVINPFQHITNSVTFETNYIINNDLIFTLSKLKAGSTIMLKLYPKVTSDSLDAWIKYYKKNIYKLPKLSYVKILDKVNIRKTFYVSMETDRDIDELAGTQIKDFMSAQQYILPELSGIKNIDSKKEVDKKIEKQINQPEKNKNIEKKVIYKAKYKISIFSKLLNLYNGTTK